jgi:DNA-binding NtrC family response regulator
MKTLPMPFETQGRATDESVDGALQANGCQREAPTEGEGLDPLLDAFPPEFRQLREQLRRVLPQETTLLLTGETGTGKTRLAGAVANPRPSNFAQVVRLCHRGHPRGRTTPHSTRA